MEKTRLAYLAGLIDGEGSLECQKEWSPRRRTPLYSLRLSLSMSTAEPLATVAAWFACGRVYRPGTDGKRQGYYRLHVPKGKAVPLLRASLPYLILKRRQAELILAIEELRAANSPACCRMGMPDGAVDQMEALYQELRSLKSNKRPVACRS